jgi:hypothetical protein
MGGNQSKSGESSGNKPNPNGGYHIGDSGKATYYSGVANTYDSRSAYPSGNNNQSSGSSQIFSNSVNLSNFSGGNVSSGKSPYYLDLDSHFLSLHNKFSTFNVGYGKIHTDPIIGGNSNYTGTYIDEIIYNVQMGVSTGTLHHKLAINLYHRGVVDTDLYTLGSKLSGVTLNLCLFDLQKNNITTLGMNNFIHFFKYQNINHIDFSSNKLGDAGCGEVGAALAAGWLPNLHAIDLSDNQITNTGHGYIAKALKTVTQNIFISLQKYTTDLGQKVVKPALKEFVSYAGKNGVDTSYLATNKGAIEYFKDAGKIGWNIAVGYGKCVSKTLQILFLDFTAPSLTVDYLIEKSGKEALKKANLNLCVFIETCDAFVTPEGVDLAVKGVELLGE